MSQKVCIDIVFIANFLMDYVLLQLVSKIMRFRKKQIHFITGALTGAAFACCISYLLIIYKVKWLYILHAPAALLMLEICFRNEMQKYHRRREAILYLYVTAMLCGGIWNVCTDQKIHKYTVFVIVTAVTYGMMTAFIKLQGFRSVYRENIYPVDVFYQGKKYSTYGFYDTGNLLKDAIWGRPVSVIKAEALKQILTDTFVEALKNILDAPEKNSMIKTDDVNPGVIICNTAGMGRQMLLTVTLELLCIYTEKEQIQIKRPVFAIVFEPSALGNEYSILLNSRLFCQEGKL